jgi:acyl-CoA thioesterase-2
MATALRLEQVGTLEFRAPVGAGRPRRVFGGQIMAQGLLAAARTVPEELGVHLMHARFVSPGDPGQPIDYVVDDAADRGSFGHRRVVAHQGETRILELTASFHRGEAGPAHQYPGEVVGDPDSVPSFAEHALGDEGVSAWWRGLSRWLPVEVRAPAVPGRWRPVAGAEFVPRQDVWLHSNDELPDDPALHAAGAAYASDLFLLTAAMVRHGIQHNDPGVLAVTLNHTMWFHAPFRVDEWWRHQQEGSWSGAGRVLCHGRMFDRSGRLVATTMQEGLVRAPAEAIRLGERRLAG